MIPRDEILRAFRLDDATGVAETFTGVSTDSRSVMPGALFFALPGPRYDGHDFVEAALENGARSAVVEADRPVAAPTRDLIRVPDTLEALQALARVHRERWSGTVAAVTGSNGKTTTKDMTAAVLGARYSVHRTFGNLNNHIGLPLTLLGLRDEHQWAVAELGMNHLGEIKMLAGIARPDIAVITNVGPAHLDGVGGVDDVLRAKLEILSAGPRAVVVGADQPEVVRAVRERFDGEVLTFGFGQDADLRGGEFRSTENGGLLELPGSATVRLRVSGRFNAYNALAALAVARLGGVPPEGAVEALESFRGTAMRFECMTVGTSLVVNDSYNANPASLRASLEAFADVAGERRRVLVLGEMFELGPRSEELHRNAAGDARRFGIDLLVGIGTTARAAVDAFGKPSYWYDNAGEAAGRVQDWLRPRDAVLLKGSRAVGVEAVLGGIRDAA